MAGRFILAKVRSYFKKDSSHCRKLSINVLYHSVSNDLNSIGRILILFSLTMLLFACNGQSSSGEKESQLSIPANQQPKEQISQVVRMMFQDSRGTFWFGTENGAFGLWGDSLIHMDDIQGERGNGVTIKDIVEDNQGNIWFGHTDGVSRLQGDSVVNYYESDGLIHNDVWCLEADADGNIWIGTFAGACVFDGEEFGKFDLPEGKIDSTLGISSTTMIHDIYEDVEGQIWFCTNAGLFSYSNGELNDVSSHIGIETNFVNEVFEDSRGEIWVSTKDGLYHIQNNLAVNITKGKLELGKGIGSVAEDKSGTKWFVSNQHYLYTCDGNELLEFEKTEENQGPVIFQIFKDRMNRMWFVGFGGAFRMENGEFVNITKEGPWN